MAGDGLDRDVQIDFAESRIIGGIGLKQAGDVAGGGVRGLVADAMYNQNGDAALGGLRVRVGRLLVHWGSFTR